jgi:hypothetical protein
VPSCPSVAVCVGASGIVWSRPPHSWTATGERECSPCHSTSSNTCSIAVEVDPCATWPSLRTERWVTVHSPQKTALRIERVMAAAVKTATTATLAPIKLTSRLVNDSMLLSGPKGSYSEVVIAGKVPPGRYGRSCGGDLNLKEPCKSRGVQWPPLHLAMSLTFSDLPEDILYAIVSPAFGKYVLNAFNGSYPTGLARRETMQPFVERMTNALMFTGIFSLLHVSRKIRSITGRLLIRAVPRSDDVPR